MKFSCQQCSTAYNVPDEKVRGKRVRIKCKKCGAPIIVEGPKGAAQRPVRSLQKTQVGGLVAPPDLAEKIQAAKKAASAPRASEGPISKPPASRVGRWTVAIDRKNPSKMTLEELVAAYGDGRVTPKTLVWKKGQPEWKTAFSVPELADALRAAGHGPEGPGKKPELPPVPALPRAPAAAGFDDDEATRVVDSPSSVPRPSATAGPPRPAAGRRALSEPDVQASPPAPADDRSNEFDDDDEATAVIDVDRAQALLKAQAAASEHGFDDEDEATRVADPASLDAGRPPSDRPTPTAPTAPKPADLPGPAFDEEDDITQVAGASAARALLEQADAGLKFPAAPAPKEGAPDKPNEPAVVVADDDRASDVEAAEPEESEEAQPTPSQREQQFSLHDETTRIVNTRKKTSRTSLVIGLIIVILASAAGGFLASRFVPPRAIPGAGR